MDSLNLCVCPQFVDTLSWYMGTATDVNCRCHELFVNSFYVAHIINIIEKIMEHEE